MKFNGHDVEIIRKNNKNTYIRVNDDLSIYITTNYFTTKQFIRNLLEENTEYIESMIEKKKAKNEFNDKFFFLGKEYILDDNIKEDEIDKWLKKQAEKIFKERLDIIYNKIEEDIPYPKLTIRKMSSRWGVCNRRLKRVTLNLELIKRDYKYIDYVIIHELSHFIYFDHSKNFWNLVSKYEKKYKEMRKELNDYKC